MCKSLVRNLVSSTNSMIVLIYLLGKEFVLPKKDEFKNFWKICIFIFTQSHGQSQVEQGFNTNKNTLQENLQEKSLNGRWLIYGEVKASGKQPHNFEISNRLKLNCKTAHARYTVDLVKNKQNQAPSRPFQERRAIACAHIHTHTKVFRRVINRTRKWNFLLHVFPT